MRNCLHSLSEGACFSIPFISSQRRGSKPSSFAILFFFVKNMLKDQLFKTSRLKFWARKVLGTLDKQAPGPNCEREASFLENMTEVPKKAICLGKRIFEILLCSWKYLIFSLFE